MGQSSSQPIDLTSEHSSETEFSLSELISNKNWDDIRDYFVYSKDTKKKKRQTLLEDDYFHSLVYSSIPVDEDYQDYIEIFELVKTVIDVVGKDIVYTKNKDGDTVLYNQAIDEKTCEMLLKYGGEKLALSQNKRGKTAAHLVDDSYMFYEERLWKFYYLAGKYPQLLNIQCIHGNTPLHDAIQNIRESSDLEYIRKYIPYFVSKGLHLKQNADGDTIFHVLCKSWKFLSSTESNIIKTFILRGRAEMIKIRNNEGKMAHEYFCAQESIKEYLQTLVCGAIVNSDWEEIQNLMSSEVLTKEIFLDLFYLESNNEFLAPAVPLSFFLFNVHTPLDLFQKVLDFVGDDGYNRSFDRRPESIMMLIIFDMIKDDTEGNKLRYDLVKLLLKRCSKEILLECYDCIYSLLQQAVKISTGTKAKDKVFEVLELLIDLGGKELVLQNSSYNGDTSLHTAFRLNADRDVIQLLLEIGGQDVVMECNQYKETPLHVAIENNADSDIVESLLDKGTQNQVLKTQDNGNTPLHLACIYGADEKILKLLLRNHCRKQIEMQNDMGQPALHLLVEYNPCLERMKLLVKKGGKKILFVRDNDDSNLLHIACIVKCLPIIEYLAKEVPSLARKRNQCGETILHCLLYQIEKQSSSLEFVQMALDATGPRLWTAQDKYGNTFLHNYAKTINEEQCMDVWKLLVDRCGGDLIQIQNIYGKTVLHAYIEDSNHFSKEIVKFMLDATTDKDIVGITNESGDTIIHEVCRGEKASVDILRTIMDRAVDRKEQLLEKGLFDKTALHIACSHPDNYEIVEYLVNLGGRDLVEAVDNRGKTAGEYNDYQVFIESVLEKSAPSLSELVDLVTCPLCLDIMTNVHCITSCHHRFCGHCIRTALDMNGDNCPVCRGDIDDAETDLKKDHTLTKIVSSIKAIQYLDDPSASLKTQLSEKDKEIEMLKKKLEVLEKKCDKDKDESSFQTSGKRKFDVMRNAEDGYTTKKCRRSKRLSAK
ncbi:hypothetical protein CTEN210_16414 [Chaetoceros tenuissimus]|uniref:RING-type domain-containing protein n=1 Tax=Chaetoceros tenuissimus TaxID=426638 RepID=A0AAD3D8Z0_9STRA|nr:hypothetical protein CTEN210_16414 [Chaetoceros tenuissimus]